MSSSSVPSPKYHPQALLCLKLRTTTTKKSEKVLLSVCLSCLWCQEEGRRRNRRRRRMWNSQHFTFCSQVLILNSFQENLWGEKRWGGQFCCWVYSPSWVVKLCRVWDYSLLFFYDKAWGWNLEFKYKILQTCN